MCIACISRGDFNAFDYHRVLPDNNGSPMDATGVNIPAGSTGDRNIDAELFGTQWNSLNLTFTFPASASYYPNPYYDDNVGTIGTQPNNFLVATPELQTAFRAALVHYASVSNLTFTEVANTAAADLTGARSTGDFTANGRFPSYGPNEGDVWFNAQNFNTPLRGSYAWATVMHELGHTLGLKHGHSNDHGPFMVALSEDKNSMEYSIMTYAGHLGADTGAGYFNEQFGYAQTLMIYDIAAIQYLYGADFTTNATNSVYTFSATTGQMFINGVAQGAVGDGNGGASNRVFRTIWDGGGADTYNFANYTTDQSISLVAGGVSMMSDLQRANLGDGFVSRGNLFNALQYHNSLASLIENAFAGSGNDTVTGNQVGNLLRGNNGLDTLIGQGGGDTLEGGAGNDLLYGDFALSGIGIGSGYTTLAPTFTNNSIATAWNITSNFTLHGDADIANSTSVHHSTVVATGNGQSAFYRVNVVAGSTITVDIDRTAVGLDTHVRLVRANGGVLVGSDDGPAPLDPGTTNFQDSRFTYTVAQTGAYYIQIGTFSDASEGKFSPTIGNGLFYELNVSVAAPVMVGLAGNDRLDGGLGADTMRGGGGSDVYVVDNILDVVDEGQAGSNGSDTVQSTINFSLANNPRVFGAVENVSLLGVAVSATGNALANTLWGNAGANVLDGLGGADIMRGRGGSDLYRVDNAGDIVDEADGGGGGVDTVQSTISFSLSNNPRVLGAVENVSLQGALNINATGNALANTLWGNSGVNILDGLGGADIMRGRGGSDLYRVDNAGDIVDEADGGGSGIDTVQSSISFSLVNSARVLGLVENLSLTGTGAISGTGNALNNTLYGNGASNVLTGGAGQDTFVFKNTLNAATNVDTITDFSVPQDTIWLENAVFTALTTLGTLLAGQFFIGAAAHDGDDRIIYNSTTGALSYDFNGNVAGGGVKFAQLASGLALTNADFFVI